MGDNLLVKKLHPDAVIPTKAHPGDLGFDLYAIEETVVPHLASRMIRTGIACSFPYDYGAILKDRSSVASKLGLFVHGGVIDNGYTGEIIVLIYNSRSTPVEIKKGAKIAQMILVPLVRATLREVEELPDTERGDAGFGSSGA